MGDVFGRERARVDLHVAADVTLGFRADDSGSAEGLITCRLALLNRMSTPPSRQTKGSQGQLSFPMP